MNLCIGAFIALATWPPRGEGPPDPYVRATQGSLASLAAHAGWMAIRAAPRICLAIAVMLKSIWPEHHLTWIAITVVLLTDRTIEAFPVKITQRTLGTLVGVVIAEAIEVSGLAAAAPALVIAVLATGRPLLRANNYLAYTVVMTR